MADAELKEETKLKLLAALKSLGKPVSTLDWANKTGVNRATVYRYMPLMQSEGWLNSKPGPGRSVLYSIKPNRAVLPVDQIPEKGKSIELKIDKKDLPERLATILRTANEKPYVINQSFIPSQVALVVAKLYAEVGKAMSGEMPSKENLDSARLTLSQVQKSAERMVALLNTMLLTPELWDPRLVSGTLAMNADAQQLGQWAIGAENSVDLVTGVLTAFAQGNYEATESSIRFDLTS